MRVIELLVDGQRIKLTTDDNIARAINVGDLKPSTRVIIWQDDEEVFVGPAGDDDILKSLFPLHLLPVTPQTADRAAQGPAATTTVPATPVQAGDDDHARHADWGVTKVQERPVEPPPVQRQPPPDYDAIQRRLQAERAMAQQEAERAAASIRPRPWRHLIAKLIDLPILAAAALFCAMWLNAALGFSGGPTFLAWVWSIPLLFMIEAAVMRVFGFTLGKALLNIQVRKNDRTVGFFSGIRRSFRSHFSGAGAWIPVLNWITMLTARSRMLRFGKSDWDRLAGNHVTYGPITPLRWAGIFAAYAATYGLYILLKMSGSN